MELYAEISATNANFRKVYKSLTDFANDGYQWYQVAELGFDSFMARHALTLS
jgi:TRAP-type mannitol/chloroaromatic compound transport system substrate-binding protein